MSGEYLVAIVHKYSIINILSVLNCFSSILPWLICLIHLLQISAGDQSNIIITLTASSTTLNEVVVTALGVKREKH